MLKRFQANQVNPSKVPRISKFREALTWRGPSPSWRRRRPARRRRARSRRQSTGCPPAARPGPRSPPCCEPATETTRLLVGWKNLSMKIFTRSKDTRYITQDCPSRSKVVNTVAPGIWYSAAVKLVATQASPLGSPGKKFREIPVGLPEWFLIWQPLSTVFQGPQC